MPELPTEPRPWWRRGLRAVAVVGLVAAPAGFVVLGANELLRRRRRKEATDGQP